MPAFIVNAWQWITGNPVARQIGVILLAVIGAFAGYKIWKANVESGVRRQMREEQQRRDLEEMGRVNDARQKATEENINAAERADEAVRDMPRYLPDELREQEPDVADRVLGPRTR